jgi:microcystin-dependent protein
MPPGSYVGEIAMFGGNFAPLGWAFCDGQLLPIDQNTALFQLIGTTYGGDGVTTFALPDLRGRHAIHNGQGPGLGAYILAQAGGVETVTLSIAEMAAHGHTPNGAAGSSSIDPTGRYWGPAAGDLPYGELPPGGPTKTANTCLMAPTALGISGGGLAHENRMPYLTVSFIIAILGIFPSQ